MALELALGVLIVQRGFILTLCSGEVKDITNMAKIMTHVSGPSNTL